MVDMGGQRPQLRVKMAPLYTKITFLVTRIIVRYSLGLDQQTKLTEKNGRALSCARDKTSCTQYFDLVLYMVVDSACEWINLDCEAAKVWKTTVHSHPL